MALRDKLKKLQKACGCRESAVSMLAALTISCMYVDITTTRMNTGLSLIGIAFAAALLGKIAGMAFARFRFYLLLRQIERTAIRH